MTQQPPLVTVGLLTYQRPQGLKRALQSIVSQTYQNLEIIVSENYSSGNKTKEIVRKFSQKDRRIFYYLHKPNRGCIFNTNFVLKKATGKYFLWAFDDDYYDKNCIKKLVKKLEQDQKIGLAMSAVAIFKDKKILHAIRFRGQYNPNNKNYLTNFWNSISFPSSKYVYMICGLFRRKLLQEVFPQITNIYAADRTFIIFFSLVSPISYEDNLLYFHQDHGIQYSNEINLFTWKNEIISIFKLVKTVIITKNIVWYRKFYLPIVIWRLFFRILMLAMVRLLGILFKATLFLPKQIEKLQILIAHRYN